MESARKFDQVRNQLVKCLLFAVLPAMACFVVSLMLLNGQGYAVQQVLRDPAQPDAPGLLGFLSNVGIWFWVSSIGIYLFTYVQSANRTNRRKRELMLLLGLLTLTLAVDDFFMIHERYVDERIMYFIYASFSISILARHHRILFRSRNISFFLAIGMLGMSVLIDINQYWLDRYVPESLRITAEDGCKFLGGAIWLYFTLNVAGRALGLRPVPTAIDKRDKADYRMKRQHEDAA